MLNKSSFVEISKNNKPVVLFGSGDIATKTIAKMQNNNIAFIVDNSNNLVGSEYQGLNIESPKSLTSKYLVIICSTAIIDISNQLDSMGLLSDVDYIVSPILNDLLAISELEGLNKTLYFTSGTIQKDKYGGGFYKCTINGEDVSLEKLYSGSCYGVVKRDDDILFVDTNNGIFSYSNNQITKVSDLPKGSRAHGISFNESNEKYYITCAYLDAILEFDLDFNICRTLLLSKKIQFNNEPMHHCNDNIAIGNSLYVTMFSSTGNWKKDCFDGCIAEFDIESGIRLGDVSSGLYMPHNVRFINGSLHVLDSLPGHIRYGNLSVQGTFPGFTRGLDFSCGLYYIGQSKNRNYSRVLGVSNNISIDCGIIVFNPDMSTSRFIQFPHKIGEIHSIVAL
jgi:hypothetical protein